MRPGWICGLVLGAVLNASAQFPETRSLSPPVNGTYQVTDDCSLTWKLQDDSGAFHHFAGKLTPDLERASFRQTDSGGAKSGTLAKTPAECSISALRSNYDLSVSGGAIPMNPGETARKIEMSGVVLIDAADGTMLRLRGIVVTGGKEILAIQTDPGATVNARLRAR